MTSVICCSNQTMPPPEPPPPIDPSIKVSDIDDDCSNESSLYETDADGPIATQTNDDIIAQINDACNGLTKKDFISKILSILDTDDIISTRDALHDYARLNKPNEIPQGSLIRRSNRNKNKRLAEDIYTLHMFIENAGNFSDVKKLLKPVKSTPYSKTRNRIQFEERNNDQSQSNPQNDIILAYLLELKVNLASETNEIKKDLTKAISTRDTSLKKDLDTKTNELNRVKDECQKVRSELKIANQLINDQQNEMKTLKESIKDLKSTVIRNIQHIHTKLDKMSNINKQQNELARCNNEASAASPMLTSVWASPSCVSTTHALNNRKLPQSPAFNPIACVQPTLLLLQAEKIVCHLALLQRKT
ncbi:unnamed protein product [Owenia fusiformis]|uniref:Uncharacterized protein n=1 Tax=Owenia fusiformis TaxID=6347 RepID=A0A8J1TEJ8_OWEFU|nr:unnamed protein product [Owenia fusiformis]